MRPLNYDTTGCAPESQKEAHVFFDGITFQFFQSNQFFIQTDFTSPGCLKKWNTARN